jgi:hypothetical protein
VSKVATSAVECSNVGWGIGHLFEAKVKFFCSSLMEAQCERLNSEPGCYLFCQEVLGHNGVKMKGRKVQMVHQWLIIINYYITI